MPLPISLLRRGWTPLAVFAITTGCIHGAVPSTALSTTEAIADQACPTTARWLATHTRYREEFDPVVSGAVIPDSLSPVWLTEPRIVYPQRGLTEQWEGSLRVIGIIDTLGHFVHADLCSLQLKRRPSEHTAMQSPLPDLDLVDAFVHATRTALDPARLTPLVLAGHVRNYLARVPIYFRFRE